MSFIYFGSSEFSRIVLEGLYQEGMRPQLVVSKTDKPKGRGLEFQATQVSNFSNSKNIPLFKPESLNEQEFSQRLKKEAVDFFIIVDYGNIVPLALLSLPKKFALGLHPSLLPCYRGSTPIEHALLKGDSQTGLTIFKVEERVDSGDIILQKPVAVDSEDDYYSLSRKLAGLGAVFLAEGLARIKSGNYLLTKQDETKASYTAKFKKEDGEVNWSWEAGKIKNFIRALTGWPSAYTCYKKLMLKIIKAEVVPAEQPPFPGEIVGVEHKGILVATGKNNLLIIRLQPAGKKAMDAWAFVCGHKVRVGEQFQSH